MWSSKTNKVMWPEIKKREPNHCRDLLIFVRVLWDRRKNRLINEGYDPSKRSSHFSNGTYKDGTTAIYFCTLPTFLGLIDQIGISATREHVQMTSAENWMKFCVPPPAPKKFCSLRLCRLMSSIIQPSFSFLPDDCANWCLVSSYKVSTSFA